MRDVLVPLMALMLVVAACSQADTETDDTVVDTTTPIVGSTTVTTTTSGGPTAASPDTFFEMTSAQILEASEPILETAEAITQALESGDRELLVSAFAPGGFVIDPVVPSLRPSIGNWFYLFQGLCPEAEFTMVYVNLSGSASAASCSDFYEGLMDDPPARTPFLPHVLMQDARGAVLLNRMDAQATAMYPAETSDAIGFRPSREEDVAHMADVAERFAPLFEAAWESGEEEPIAALYADDGVRIDGFAALDDPQSTHAWIEAFAGTYDEIGIEIELLVASAPGPGAEYTMTLGRGDDACAMRMVSAWELDDEDRIVREYVYYQPDSVFACGWQADIP